MALRDAFIRGLESIVRKYKRGEALSAAFPAATHHVSRTSTAFFPLSEARELKPQDWKEILKKSRYLRNATGLGRALFEKPVKFVCPGGLTPSAATPDEDYNERSDDYFDRWATQPVDVSHTYNFYESIEMLATETPCDGSMFALKVRGSTDRCQLQFLKAHQIGDSPHVRDGDNRRFTNGILRNSVGRPLVYRVLQEAETPGLISSREYSAEDMLHIFDPSRMSSFGRPLPWIYHGANSALDVLDMRALDQVARKLNLLLAGVIKKTGTKGAGLGVKLSKQDLAEITAAANGEELTSEEEQTAEPSPITWEQILGGGAVPILREGEEFQTIDKDRSPTNWIQASEFLIREIAAGYGVSFEFIWNMAALGGPTARMMLEDLNAFCEKFRRMLIGRYAQSVRSWVIANGIIHGELEEPKAGNWWDCVWSGPPKVTVDRQQAAIYAKMIEKGMMTLDEWWSMLGLNGKRQRKKRITEIREDLLECERQKVPYSLYCATAPGSNTDIIAVSSIAEPGSPQAMALAKLLEHPDVSVVEAVRELFGDRIAA